MSWHVGEELLTRYRDGALAPSAAWSVETHVQACGDCRDLLAGDAPVVAVPGRADRLEHIWTTVADDIVAVPPGLLERALRMVGVDDGQARLAALLPDRRSTWLAAVVGVCAVALGVAHAPAQLDERAVVPFLAAAPVLLAVAVLLSHGALSSPLAEVETAAPMSRGQLLLTRAVTVLGGALAVLGLTASALPGAGWLALAWVLPALAMATATLALLTWLSPLTAVVVTTGTWLAVLAVVPMLARAPSTVVFNGAGQLVSLAVMAAATVTAWRRSTSGALA